MGLITLKEYAEKHGVIVNAVQGKIYRGTIHAEKHGGTWLIDEDEPYIDLRRRGYNDGMLLERNQAKQQERYVAFMKRKKRSSELYTVVYQGMRKDFSAKLEKTGDVIFYILNYKDVQYAASASGEDLEKWITKYKNKSVLRKRRDVAEYLHTGNHMEVIDVMINSLQR